MASSDKTWAAAKEYILDPLTAPQPADETGPGTSFRPDNEPHGRASMVTPPQSAVSGQNMSSKTMPSTTKEVNNGYSSPPQSRSPHQSPRSHRQEAFGQTQQHRRRSSSLGERFPGDMSHRPLDQLAKEKAVADRSRHVTKKHHIQPDGIDKLDGTAAGGAYHHSGPYDATLFARNNSYESSPVQAVANSNREAMKATPKEKVADSLERHRPLDGVAAYAPGQMDPNGNVYNYKQGENMMTDLNPEGGAYKRWPGVQYHPDDIKGKGEPSYTIEKALKKDNDNNDGREKGSMEMTDRPRGDSLSQALRSEGFEYDDGAGVRRSGSFGKRLSGGLKKRIGSIKRGNRSDS